MGESAAKKLKITIVTPEKAVLDESADFVVLPLFDGELGVLPGRAALVGQLAPGELRYRIGIETKRFFIDGGFVQVHADNINVLTPGAKRPEELSDALVNAERTKADALPAANAIEKETKKRASLKVKGMEKVKSKP